MLFAGERPQPLVTPPAAAIVNPSSHVPLSKAHVMPDLSANSSSSTPTTVWKAQPSKPMHVQHIWVVTGPAGSGKSTVGEGLRKELGLPFLEGDDYHSQSNRDKMGNGVPLTDEDRWDWLISIRKAAIDALSSSESNNFHPPAGVIVACSALKQKYRDVMRVAAYGSPSVQIHFIYLKLSEDCLMQRVRKREAHYMKSGMVHSQLQALEEPQDEWDTMTINVEVSPEKAQQRVLEAVTAKLSEHL